MELLCWFGRWMYPLHNLKTYLCHSLPIDCGKRLSLFSFFIKASPLYPFVQWSIWCKNNEPFYFCGDVYYFMPMKAVVTHPVKRIFKFILRDSFLTSLAGSNSECGHWGGVCPKPCSLGSSWQRSCRRGFRRPYLDLRCWRGTDTYLLFFYFYISFKDLVKLLARPCGPQEPSWVRLPISIDFSGSWARLPWSLIWPPLSACRTHREWPRFPAEHRRIPSCPGAQHALPTNFMTMQVCHIHHAAVESGLCCLFQKVKF